MPHHHPIVTQEDAGMRLDKWLKHHYAIPHSLVQKLLRKGAIRVDGKRVKADILLTAGQQVKLPDVSPTIKDESGKRPPAIITEEHVSHHLISRIIYEDEHFLAINKHAGIPVQGGSNIALSLDMIMRSAPKIFPTVFSNNLRLTHRLDKDTSGVLLLAKTKEAATAATDAFKEKSFQKTYWALVKGVPSPVEGSILAPLSEATPDGRQEKTVLDETKGKRAVTHYRVLEKAGKTMSWLELNPETGRKHQLRAHLTLIEHPIVGDGKYGGKEAFIEGISKKMHLHAVTLEHPSLLGKQFSIHASLPSHMAATWQLLEWEAPHQH